VNLTPGQVALVPENTTGDFFTVSAYDVNQQSIQFMIVGGADVDKFEIGYTTGVLSFVNPLDFEAPTDANLDNVYEVIVRITDGTLSREALLKVEITDESEGP